jgi:hypothetical protein
MAPDHYDPRPDAYEPPPGDQYQPPYPANEEKKPKPWYRKTALLLAWALLVLVLIALIVYGIGELIGGDESTTTPSPSSSTTSATTTSETTSASTTPSSTESTTTPASGAPPSGSGTQHPTQQPTQQPGPSTSTHHHPHLPPLPSVITIPDGPTYTLPRGAQ